MNKFVSKTFVGLAAAFAIVSGPLAATAHADDNHGCPKYTEPVQRMDGSNVWYECVPTVERHR